MKSTPKQIKLDWTKLLGFNQVAAAQNSTGSKASRAMIGAKVGGKAGLKPAAKAGVPSVTAR